MNRWIEDQWDNFVKKNVLNGDEKTMKAIKKVYFAGARDGINLTMAVDRVMLMEEVTSFAEQVNAPKH